MYPGTTSRASLRAMKEPTEQMAKTRIFAIASKNHIE